MKKLWPCVLLLLGNEIVSYITLTVLLLIFFVTIVKQAEGRC